MPVAIPAAVGPLPEHEPFRQVPSPSILCLAEPSSHGKSVGVDRPVDAVAVTDLQRVPWLFIRPYPGQHRFERGHDPRLTGRHAELDERDEAPVRTHPFLVRVNTKAAVRLLSREQPGRERSAGYLFGA